jgi:acyl-CoA synthetase (AMP-forming)/AMP-acid ligase II
MFGVEAPAPIPRTRYVDDSELAERAFNRLSRTFIAQVDALKKYRTGGEQKMTAEHVHVHEGGQAPMTGLCWKMRWTGCAGPNWRPTKCPKQDVFLDELPKTTTGEIRKVELREVVAEN